MMGTQGPGRKRIPNRERLTAEDDALSQIAREAEARLAAKRAARAEAREIRMKELERQQKEVSDDEERMSVGSRGSLKVEERPDRDFLEKGSRTASTLSAATLASLGGASSRRGSCDTSFSVETEASIRDMKDSLAEAEEKYRKAMVSNAQLHNEKSTLMFQVETLREELSDMEELLWEARRHGDDRTKECERERQAHSVLQFQFKEMRDTLRQTEELLTEVSALRLQSGVYCQEISDLQEALQWKEKKIGALERQIEISDIVRIERDRLRDEVVRLRDLLKKHGVVVSPEVTTNGETGLDEAEDDVTAESASRLAQEPSHGGRESMLGNVRERQAADVHSSCWIYQQSRSLSVISTSDRTRADTLKQAKGTNKQARDRKDRADKRPGRNEGANKQPRNTEGIYDTTKKTRQDANLLLRNEGIKKQPKPKSAVTRSIVHNQAFKGRTRPDSEPGVTSSSVSHQDVLVIEMERSFDEGNPKTQINVGGTRLTAVSAVGRASAEKIHKSRLVPPRTAEDIILDNKALASIVTAGKQNCLTQEKQKQDVAAVVENETSSSDRDVAQTSSSAVDQSFQNPDEDERTSRDEGCSERVEPDISTVCAEEKKTNEMVAQMSVNSLKENEFVEIEQCDEVTEVLTDSETETFVSRVKTSLKHQQETDTENQAELSYTDLSEGPNFETKLRTMEDDLTLPVVKAMSDERWGTPEEHQEPVKEVLQIQDTIQHNSSERPDHEDQTEEPKSSTVSAFVSSDMWKDRSGLEKMFHSVLQGFMEDRGFAAEISQRVPEITEFIQQWVSDLEKGNASDQMQNKPSPCERVDHESAGRVMETELPVKDSPGGSKSAVRHVAITKACSVSEMLEVPSLQAHPQPEDVSVDSSGSSSKICEDDQDPPARDDQEAAENTSGVSSGACDPEMEVNKSSAEEGKLSQSCSEDFIFISSYFAEPVKTRSVESGSDASTDPKMFVEVVSEQKEQSEIVPVEDLNETHLEPHRTSSTKSHVVGQSSKVRRLLEITDEIRAMAVPELALMSLQEGRIIEDRWIDESPGLSVEVQEEASVADTDSCEEVDEEATQQPAERQEGRPEEKHLSGRRRVCLHKHKTECKIS
ncbi:uncharacterized protein lrrfip1b isoform X2 [Thunnus albacares]|uniref:uncharacterized protein lrrfip1b isoform X2 n=1 Tax=Thunnus albacares TaxID=8236 RepID=UPI001CF68836|nr:uncharacterized protein lrrfip1b isoform X2 [Thunnus albacares]